MAKKCTTLKTTDELIADTVFLVNDIRAKLKGDYPIKATGLTIGTSLNYVANNQFDYTINGVIITKAAVPAGSVIGAGTEVPQNKYGASSLNIDSSGTITYQEAVDNAIGYDTEEDAILGIPDPITGTARMGTVSVIRTDTFFLLGVTDLNIANSTVVYTDGETNIEAIGGAVA